MNGFKAKNNFSEGVEKCIARGIRCFAAMPKKALVDKTKYILKTFDVNSM